MMDAIEVIDRLIEVRHLLRHPFYEKWVAGTLPKEAIQDYARQYYAFESHFPRFLSAIHSRSDRPDVRQTILGNLWDEEHGEENHAELWLRFAEGVGVSRDEVASAERNDATRALVQTYREASTEAPTAGIAAVHAYEAQVPAIAAAKIKGLREHYGMNGDDGTKFWEVHETLDVEHAGAERHILEDVAEEEPAVAIRATASALDAWWRFLDAVNQD